MKPIKKSLPQTLLITFSSRLQGSLNCCKGSPDLPAYVAVNVVDTAFRDFDVSDQARVHV